MAGFIFGASGLLSGFAVFGTIGADSGDGVGLVMGGMVGRNTFGVNGGVATGVGFTKGLLSTGLGVAGFALG